MARVCIQTDIGKEDPRELLWGISRVGRSSDNEVVIEHASISSHHCEIELSLNSLVLRDLNSTNGTFVREQRVQEVRLEPNELFRLGQVWLKAEWSPEQVNVPKLEVQLPPESARLTDGVISCRYHLTTASTWHCPKCAKYFCVDCTRGVNLVGRPMHKLCPLCSGLVELAPWADPKSKKKTLWSRVRQALGRTMRVE